MDPNATLERLLALANRIIHASDEGRPVDPFDAVMLAEGIEVLDEWLSRDGAVPERWFRTYARSETFGTPGCAGGFCEEEDSNG